MFENNSRSPQQPAQQTVREQPTPQAPPRLSPANSHSVQQDASHLNAPPPDLNPRDSATDLCCGVGHTVKGVVAKYASALGMNGTAQTDRQERTHVSDERSPLLSGAAQTDRQGRTQAADERAALARKAISDQIGKVYPEADIANLHTHGTGEPCFSSAGRLLEEVMVNVYRMNPAQELSEVQVVDKEKGQVKDNVLPKGPSFANFRVTSNKYDSKFNHAFNVLFDEGKASVIQSYVDQKDVPTTIEMTSDDFATRLGQLTKKGEAASAYRALFGVNDKNVPVPADFVADEVGMTSLGKVPGHHDGVTHAEH